MIKEEVVDKCNVRTVWRVVKKFLMKILGFGSGEWCETHCCKEELSRKKIFERLAVHVDCTVSSHSIKSTKKNFSFVQKTNKYNFSICVWSLLKISWF